MEKELELFIAEIKNRCKENYNEIEDSDDTLVVYNQLCSDVKFYIYENLNVFGDIYEHGYYFNKKNIELLTMYFFKLYDVTFYEMQIIIDKANAFTKEHNDITPFLSSEIAFELAGELSNYFAKNVIDV